MTTTTGLTNQNRFAADLPVGVRTLTILPGRIFIGHGATPAVLPFLSKLRVGVQLGETTPVAIGTKTTIAPDGWHGFGPARSAPAKRLISANDARSVKINAAAVVPPQPVVLPIVRRTGSPNPDLSRREPHHAHSPLKMRPSRRVDQARLTFNPLEHQRPIQAQVHRPGALVAPAATRAQHQRAIDPLHGVPAPGTTAPASTTEPPSSTASAGSGGSCHQLL